METSKTVIIPIDKADYEKQINDRKRFGYHLDKLIERHPEIFPSSIQDGYIFKGWTKPCKKVEIQRRRILVKSNREEYTIHPCFVLPYLRGSTEKASVGLRMRKYNLPYHVIAETFGFNSMFWYRLELSLSDNNLVGATIKDLSKLPEHILVDEHHDKLLGQKVYVCTTIADNCFLGASVSSNISFEALKESYGIFKQEARILCPDYSPRTINMDGFKSTRQTMSFLFPDSTPIICFLHGYLKIQTNAAKRHSDYFNHIASKVWDSYKSINKRSFSQRIRRLEEWTTGFVPDSTFKNAILKLCQKKRIPQILRLHSMSKNFKYVGQAYEVSGQKTFLLPTFSWYFT